MVQAVAVEHQPLKTPQVKESAAASQHSNLTIDVFDLRDKASFRHDVLR